MSKKNTWGIGEWFGEPIESLSPQKRKELAQAEIRGAKNTEIKCPFKPETSENPLCHKKGGVCSIRLYNEDQTAVLSIDKRQPATVCPTRFLQSNTIDGESTDIFRSIADEVFGEGAEYSVVPEVPFLLSVDKDGKAKDSTAGRVDWVLIEGNRTDLIREDGPKTEIQWAAIETQAVYFSGSSMTTTFENYAKDGHLPATGDDVQRRPDWRSSGAKRLAPQLETKSSRFSRWSRKVVVVVDEAFWENIVDNQNPPEALENADIVWAIVSYDEDSKLFVKEFVLSELDKAIEALQATKPMTKAAFENTLRAKSKAMLKKEQAVLKKKQEANQKGSDVLEDA